MKGPSWLVSDRDEWSLTLLNLGPLFTRPSRANQLGWKDSRAAEGRGCAFQPMSQPIYGILASAAVVSCNVKARSVSVRMLPSDPTE